MSVTILISAPNYQVVFSMSDIPNPNKNRKEFVAWCRRELAPRVEAAYTHAELDTKVLPPSPILDD